MISASEADHIQAVRHSSTVAVPGRTGFAALAAAPDWAEDSGMTYISRSLGGRVIASLCVCWTAYCGAYRSNVAPLAFGMTPDQAASALGGPLVYHSGRPGSEIYLARGSTGIPGFYPVDSGIALQFRKGRLTGWKKDWQLRRPWPF